MKHWNYLFRVALLFHTSDENDFREEMNADLVNFYADGIKCRDIIYNLDTVAIVPKTTN